MPSDPRRSQSLLRLLNALPIDGGIVEWLAAFRDALIDFLGDVDRIMVDVNYLCDLTDPENYNPAKSMTQHIDLGEGEKVAIETESRDVSPSARLIQQARNHGFNPDLYYPPVTFEYYFAERAYLGTVILWRERGSLEVSVPTRELLEEMRPFIVWVLSDLVARHHYSRPVDRAFHQTLARIATDLKLTDREQEVLAIHLFGYPYQTIAEMIHIGIDAVRKHVKSIHRKAGVVTYTELFAKYFTPRLFLQEQGGTEVDGGQR